MPYLRVSIATWKVDLDSAEGQAVAQQVREEWIPLLRGLPGFVRYQAAITGPRTTATVFEWASEAQAQAGAERLAEWLRRSGVGQQIDSFDAQSGEVTLSAP
jgi:hypothetical protein